MEHFGETFRQLRTYKGMTLKYVTQGITSVSLLSKFERNECELTFPNFNKLLQRINVTLNEFMYIHNQYTRDNFKEFVALLRQQYTQGNVEAIKNRLNQEIENSDDLIDSRLNIIMIKSILADLTGEPVDIGDIEYLTNYLWSVEYWHDYEITLYGNSLHILPVDSVILLSKEIFNKGHLYTRLLNYRRDMYGVIFNTIRICIKKGRFDDAQYFLNMINNSKPSEQFILEKMLCKFWHGILLISSGNHEEGINICNNFLSFLQITESHGNYTLHSNYLEETIKKHEQKTH
ncbi:hypothetical protein [Solibacillus sp. CAU 1738]|uniref:helix-turn-helix domain-containing protein n=1 Tax=Solibacillus sp. CAU 1738 TaxID=3140363 RepID=UPI0032610E45